MRYFICALDASNMIRFGIPAESTGHIIQISRSQSSFVENADNDVFVSLPALFKQSFTTPHGVVLKLENSSEKKVILLTPKIEKDIEIPDNKVRALPKVFSGPFVFFNGMFFSDDNPVFIFNPKKLTERVK